MNDQIWEFDGDRDADSAYLRLVFLDATEEYAKIFGCRDGKTPVGWRPTKEDVQIQKIWAKMYVAIRDSETGRGIISHLVDQDSRIRILEEENARLLRESTHRPDNIVVHNTASGTFVGDICTRCRKDLAEQPPDKEFIYG